MDTKIDIISLSKAMSNNYPLSIICPECGHICIVYSSFKNKLCDICCMLINFNNFLYIKNGLTKNNWPSKTWLVKNGYLNLNKCIKYQKNKNSYIIKNLKDVSYKLRVELNKHLIFIAEQGELHEERVNYYKLQVEKLTKDNKIMAKELNKVQNRFEILDL